MQRFVTIWFRYLKTDWFARKNAALRAVPFVLSSPDHGRMLITATNVSAARKGILPGMTLADAKAIIPDLQQEDDQPELPAKLLRGLAEWCIRFTPFAALSLPDSLILNVTGCSHLWGSEARYLAAIKQRLNEFHYDIKIAMADTAGASWALAHFGEEQAVAAIGAQAAALMSLPPASLRLDFAITEQLEKLGLRQIRNFIEMPRTALRRRFGKELLLQLDRALGNEEEILLPIQPAAPFHERLPCLEPIVTATGIRIAVERLLTATCTRLQKEGKGLRVAVLKCYRSDGKIETVQIGTHRGSADEKHLYKLFELKTGMIEPASGIDLFTLDALKTEELIAQQEKLFRESGDSREAGLAALLDRVEGKFGPGHIHRYEPAQHYWPERSFAPMTELLAPAASVWQASRPRPLQILCKPEQVEVTAPVPDYPPMNFRYRGKLHTIKRADGPERIEQEWWLQEGEHRDYYYVEDGEGCRYWLFRSGHYDPGQNYRWFIHGFFA